MRLAMSAQAPVATTHGTSGRSERRADVVDHGVAVLTSGDHMIHVCNAARQIIYTQYATLTKRMPYIDDLQDEFIHKKEGICATRRKQNRTSYGKETREKCS